MVRSRAHARAAKCAPIELASLLSPLLQFTSKLQTPSANGSLPAQLGTMLKVVYQRDIHKQADAHVQWKLWLLATVGGDVQYCLNGQMR